MKVFFILLTLFLLSNISSAQSGSYKRIDDIPVYQNGIKLTNPWAGGLNHPLFSEIDLNGDGLKDLFAFSFAGSGANARIECFVNQGTADSINYLFSSAYYDHFPYLHDWAFLRDFNCDGKEDIFTFADDNLGIKVYENISIGNNLQFKLVSPSLTMIKNSQPATLPSNSIMYPAIIDVDNDGDLDILAITANQPRSVIYYKNRSAENGWGCDSLTFQCETSCWGNFALCIGPNKVCSWDTCAYPGAGVFHFDYNPAEAARRDDSLTNIFAFDNNGDGAKDILIGDLAGHYSLLVVNDGTPAAAHMVSQDLTFPGYDTPIDMASMTNHSYVDINNDGKKDLLVSSTFESNINSVLLYKNDNTTASPHFSYRENLFLQDQMIDVGEGASPVFFDYDGDGRTDLIIANNFYSPQLDGIGTALALYKNTGTLASPAFELITTDFANISVLNLPGSIYAAFGDMDGDGQEDLIVGCGDGTLQYFRNTALLGMPANFTLTTVNYFNIHAGQNATPQIIDLDRDGAPDLVLGNRNGYLKYYHNAGTKYVPDFNSLPTNDSLGMVNTTYSTYGYSVPFIYNDSSHYKMFLAGQEGYLIQYGSIDGNLNGAFTLIDTIIKKSEGERLTVSGADLNNDGKIDLAVGNYDGGAGIFSQNMTVSVNNFAEVNPAFEILPNPSNNVLNIRFHHLENKNAGIKIENMLGQNLKDIKVNASTMSIDVSGLSNGIYLAVLQTERFRVTRKFIIQH